MKLNRLTLAFLLVATPALAGTMYNDNGAIIIGPDGQWKPSLNCLPPIAAAGSEERDKQQKVYNDCVETEARADMKTIQNNMANSLQIIETDSPTSQNGLDVIQRQTRSAAQQLGVNH
jgi:hypothetical protein